MSKKWKKRPPRSKLTASVETGIHSLRIQGASEGFELIEAEVEGKRLKRFSMVAYTGVPMRVGFGHPVVVDLEGMEIPSQQRPVLMSHNLAQIVGHTVEIDKLQSRLKVSGIISGVGEAATEVMALAANGFPWQASIGASVERMEFVDRGESVKVNGRVFSGPLNVARKTTLGEISFVALGADDHTSASVAANREGEAMEPKFREWLTARGFDPDQLSDLQKSALQAAWKADQPPPAPATAPAPSAAVQAARILTIDDIAAQRLAEEQRIRDLTAMTDRAMEDYKDDPEMISELSLMCRTAIEQKNSKDQYELSLLRSTRARPVMAVHRRKPGDVFPEDPEVLEAAVCRAGGLKSLEQQFGSRVLEASHKHWKHGLGLSELILTFARRGGYQGMSLNASGLTQALRSAFDIRAAGSTSPSLHTLGDLLSNVANKFSREAFMSVDSAWRMISATRNVSDFKEISSFSLTGDLTYREVPPGGELHHGTLGAEQYNNQAKTYGRMLGLDRRDLINDDLGALTAVGRRLGRGGAIKLNKVFWTEFLDNAAFFAAGNSNVSTGAGSALGLAGLNAAHQIFLLQTDPDGELLATMPKILLVPPALDVSAQTLMSSTMLIDGTSTAATGSANVWAGKFRVVTSPYMQDSTLTGNSSTAWYLLADPMDLPVIEVAFLNGVETPTVESADADFGTLGIAFRGFHDFGVEKQEPRGGVRSAGT